MKIMLPLIIGMGINLVAAAQSQREGVVPPAKPREPFITKEFRLDPAFFWESGLIPNGPAEVRHFFTAHGVDFSNRATIFYKPTEQILIARNDQLNLDRIENLIIEWNKKRADQ